MSHLSDVDFDRLARLEDKLDAQADHEQRIRVLARLRWLLAAFAAAVSAIRPYTLRRGP